MLELNVRKQEVWETWSGGAHDIEAERDWGKGNEARGKQLGTTAGTNRGQDEGSQTQLKAHADVHVWIHVVHERRYMYRS